MHPDITDNDFTPCDILYLFNTAEYWSNTGITVTKGDKIYVTASGAFFNDIAEQNRIARENVKYASVSMIRPVFPTKDNYNPSNAMKSARVLPGADFGAVLYSIGPDAQTNDKSLEAHELKFSPDTPTVIEPQKVGILRFCINDIYFSDSLIPILLADSTAQMKIVKKLSINKKDPKLMESLSDSLKAYPNLWFRDNNGEILLNIIVDHNVSAINHFGTANRVLSSVFTPLNRLINPAVNDHGHRALYLSITTISVIASLLILDNMTGRLRRRGDKRRKRSPLADK